MPVKITKKASQAKDDAVKPVPAKAVSKSKKYFRGIGRRKESIAEVRFSFLQKTASDQNTGEVVMNGIDYKKYLPSDELRNIVVDPIQVASIKENFAVSIRTRGGGVRGQAEASRLGIARALVKFNEEFRKPLRDKGYLTRDARIVERKKPGLKKARRAPQWQKR
ncbi:MAG: 30S ribosomal protein S9 [Parcubacteria group bacterium]|jgi:small subunit ribosomal protein S9